MSKFENQRLPVYDANEAALAAPDSRGAARKRCGQRTGGGDHPNRVTHVLRVKRFRRYPRDETAWTERTRQIARPAFSRVRASEEPAVRSANKDNARIAGG